MITQILQQESFPTVDEVDAPEHKVSKQNIVEFDLASTLVGDS